MLDTNASKKTGAFALGLPNIVAYDYTADGTKRSIEASLKRLRTDRLDIVWVHQHRRQRRHGDQWLERFEEAPPRRLPRPAALRDQGVITSWGIGANRTEPMELALDLDEPQPDAFLLANRYTLLDHEHALQRLLPEAKQREVNVVVGGPYNSGLLVGGAHYEYGTAPAKLVARVARINEIAAWHGVATKAGAALQFALAHPAIASVIPGASRHRESPEDLEEWGSGDPGGLLARTAPGRTNQRRRPTPVASAARDN